MQILTSGSDILAAREKGLGKEQSLPADSNLSFFRALGITWKPQLLQQTAGRWRLQLLYATCAVSCSLHIPCVLLPAVTLVGATSSISRRSLSLLPGDRAGTTAQETHLDQETPVGIRHTITPTSISGLCFFIYVAFILHHQHSKEQCHRSRESDHEKCKKGKPSMPTNLLHKALTIRVYHKINIRTACQNAFNWVQAEPVHNRSRM